MEYANSVEDFWRWNLASSQGWLIQDNNSLQAECAICESFGSMLDRRLRTIQKIK